MVKFWISFTYITLAIAVATIGCGSLYFAYQMLSVDPFHPAGAFGTVAGVLFLVMAFRLINTLFWGMDSGSLDSE